MRSEESNLSAGTAFPVRSLSKSQSAAFALKIAITLACFWYLLRHIDAAELRHRIQGYLRDHPPHVRAGHPYEAHAGHEARQDEREPGRRLRVRHELNLAVVPVALDRRPASDRQAFRRIWVVAFVARAGQDARICA